MVINTKSYSLYEFSYYYSNAYGSKYEGGTEKIEVDTKYILKIVKQQLRHFEDVLSIKMDEFPLVNFLRFYQQTIDAL